MMDEDEWNEDQDAVDGEEEIIQEVKASEDESVPPKYSAALTSEIERIK